MTLTPAELADLSGYTSPRYQQEWLRQNGIPFALDRRRRPKVLRSAVERQFGGTVSGPRKTAPDFDSLDDAATT